MFVDSAELTESDTVVEVGPGKGSITKLLLEKAGRVIAVEKDDNLYILLQSKFADEIAVGKLILVHGDILEFKPAEYRLTQGAYKVIGSIPYYITGIFIRTFMTIDPQPQSVSLIVQKEVAQRIVAKDGKESMLSISVKVFGTPRYVSSIKAREFSPKPKVDSAILTITDMSHDFFNGMSEEKFFTVMKKGFSSKRKKLIGNLSALYRKDVLEKFFAEVGISLDVRAEKVSYDQWGKLVKKII